MNEWHRKRRDGETDMEKWMGIGFESMKCSQCHLWHTCLPLEMANSHLPWQVRLCICKLNLRRDKEDCQAVLPVLTLPLDSLILNSSSTTFLCDFSQVTQPLQTCRHLPLKELNEFLRRGLNEDNSYIVLVQRSYHQILTVVHYHIVKGQNGTS